MNLVNAILFDGDELPPIDALGYQYVVAANGLFVRAEDSRIAAMVPVAESKRLSHGLKVATPYVRLKVPRVPEGFLYAIYNSARKHMPNEVMYQFAYVEGDWKCWMPDQVMTPSTVKFTDTGLSTIDLHSHNTMQPFFSATDDGDELGLRFYVVIGSLGTRAGMICRVGVYGHFWGCPASDIFDVPVGDPMAWPFVDLPTQQKLERNAIHA